MVIATSMAMAAPMTHAAAPASTTAAAVKAATKPSVELLEFLAEWSEQDAELLDGFTTAAKRPPAKPPAATAPPRKGGR